MTNTPVPPTLLVNSVLDTPRYNNTDQFSDAIRTGGTAGPWSVRPPTRPPTGTGQTITAGTGTTGTYTGTTATTYTVTNGYSANSTKYATTITCTDAKNLQPNLPTNAVYTGSLDITLVAGAAVTCVIHYAVTPESLSLVKNGPSTMTVGAVTSYTLDVTNGGGLPAARTCARSTAGQHRVRERAGQRLVVHGDAATCRCRPAARLHRADDCRHDGSSTLHRSACGRPPRRPVRTVVNKASVSPTGGPNPPTAEHCTGNNTPARLCGRARQAGVDPRHCYLQEDRHAGQPGYELRSRSAIRSSGQFVVTNTSQVTVDNLVVSDPTAGAVTCPVTTLAAGASTTCTAAANTPSLSTDVDAGEVNNTATATATLPGCTGTIGARPARPSRPTRRRPTTPTISSPTIELTKALGSDRYNDDDQFIVAIRTSSATGTVVSDPTDSTTTGTGDTVDDGTGTTGIFAATTGTAYYLTEDGQLELRRVHRGDQLR